MRLCMLGKPDCVVYKCCSSPCSVGNSHVLQCGEYGGPPAGIVLDVYIMNLQIYGGCRPSDVESFSWEVAECVAEVANCMRCNRLHLNVDNTELFWFSTPRLLLKLPASAIPLGGHDIIPSTSARNLGVYFDVNLSMRRHVDIISGGCFASLRQQRGIPCYVTAPVLRGFWLVWGTATVRCSDYRLFGLLGCSQYRTLQLGWCLICGELVTS
jgi:hypothetical protein